MSKKAKREAMAAAAAQRRADTEAAVKENEKQASFYYKGRVSIRSPYSSAGSYGEPTVISIPGITDEYGGTFGCTAVIREGIGAGGAKRLVLKKELQDRTSVFGHHLQVKATLDGNGAVEISDWGHEATCLTVVAGRLKDQNGYHNYVAGYEYGDDLFDRESEEDMDRLATLLYDALRSCYP